MKTRARKTKGTITQRVRDYKNSNPESSSPEIAKALKLSIEQVYSAVTTINKEKTVKKKTNKTTVTVGDGEVVVTSAQITVTFENGSCRITY